MILNKVRKIHQVLKWKVFLLKHHIPLNLNRGDWSMHVEDFQYIIRFIKRKTNLFIVELGAGTSTVVLAYTLSKYCQNSLLMSFEAEESWVEKVHKDLSKYKLNSYAVIYHVPYKRYHNYIWFDHSLIREILFLFKRKIDILIVDAPPDTLCPYSRMPAIPFFLEYLKEDSVVFLHDSKRSDELFIIKEWSNYFKEIININTPQGLAEFRYPILKKL